MLTWEDGWSTLDWLQAQLLFYPFHIRLQCDLLTTGSPIQRQRKQPKESVAAKEIYISLMKL